MTGPRFFDTHAHLDGKEFAADLESVLARAREAGVTDIVCIGASDGLTSNPRALAVAERQEGLHATVGVHPHDARLVDDACLATIRSLAAHPKVVGIGETGLDYHYDHSPRDRQTKAFSSFLEMAKALDLACVVHTRDAEEDTVRILNEAGARDMRGVLHCFTGTAWLADQAFSLGWYVSFSGVLTFRNAEPLRDIARSAPRDRVLVETDCPYLAPIPNRGKRNEPSFVVHTAARLAELWSEPLERVLEITGENAVRLFER